MEDRSVIHSTFVIERNYPAPPERARFRFKEGTPLKGVYEPDHLSGHRAQPPRGI
jgi:hypothetical protein